MSHVDEAGKARMVDVGEKSISRRVAVAQAVVVLSEAASEAIRSNTIKKGDVLGVARIAAIAAAKRTDELIPLCHSVPLDKLEVRFLWLDACRLKIEAEAIATARTGVEMEALVASTNAALTVYDMCKAIDKSISIEAVELVSKTGGLRGDYQRGATDPASSE